MRGTRKAQTLADAKRRFIPACAGNAATSHLAQIAVSVHPRVCGERAPAEHTFNASIGSSPRVRGTPRRPLITGQVLRFIPACAGNASDARSTASAAAVHPRVCGERNLRISAFSAVRGSSPRVRGTRPVNWPDLTCYRFIPACAGNASIASTPAKIIPVHPRVCGERRILSTRCGQTLGSSPRVRGTQNLLSTQHMPGRFIPACAGNAQPIAVPIMATAVHPRVCGERVGFVFARAVIFGSSPRVRGTRQESLDCGCLTRFIPACAGNA